MDMDSLEIKEFKEVIERIVDERIRKSGVPKYISAIVSNVNSDTKKIDVYLPPDNNVLTGILNKTGELLNVGDSVELCTKNGSVNNSWVAIKHKTSNSGEDEAMFFNQIYPVGIEVTFHNNEDRTNWLGFTWERCSEGLVGVGLDTTKTEFNAVGKTGGTTSTKHAFPFVGINSSKFQSSPMPYLTSVMDRMNAYVSSTSTANINRDVTIQNVGGNIVDGADVPTEVSYGYYNSTNLQPYEVKAIWKRIK